MATPGQVAADAGTWVSEKVPYLWGGVTRFGADCSGFVKAVYAEVGYTINGRTSQQEATLGAPVAGLGSAQAGDLIFYNYEGPNSHVAIYAGNGMQYAETSAGHPATLQSVDTAAIGQIRRYIDAAGNPIGPGVTASAPTAALTDAPTPQAPGVGPGGGFWNNGPTIPDPANIPGDIAGAITGGLVQPLITFIDDYAIRAALFTLGAIAVVVGLIRLFPAEEQAEHQAAGEAEKVAPAVLA